MSKRNTLSTKEMKEYAVIFEQMDLSKDGYVDFKEMVEMLGNYTEDQDALNEFFFNNADANNDQVMDIDEFYAIIHKKKIDSNLEEEFMDIFEKYKPINGLLSSKNFKKTRSPFGIKLEDNEIDEIMKLVDNDGDGYINFEEFVHLMLLAKNKQLKKNIIKNQTSIYIYINNVIIVKHSLHNFVLFPYNNHFNKLHISQNYQHLL